MAYSHPETKPVSPDRLANRYVNTGVIEPKQEDRKGRCVRKLHKQADLMFDPASCNPNLYARPPEKKKKK